MLLIKILVPMQTEASDCRHLANRLNPTISLNEGLGALGGGAVSTEQSPGLGGEMGRVGFPLTSFCLESWT